jgi:uracil-DNA glycosylase
MKAFTSISDRPKLLADPLARNERASGLNAPHMKPLSDFVTSLRQAVGEGASIPDFDPWDGGVDAEVLFLLEAPGRKAVASGFISRNNPDETAKNFFELSSEAGITRSRSVVWNIVPWYIGSGSKIRPASTIDVTSGASSLAGLLDLLPNLRVIVLLGRKAEYAERIISPLRPRMRILKSPHPSPLFVNNPPGNRERVLEVFREAAGILTKMSPHAGRAW